MRDRPTYTPGNILVQSLSLPPDERDDFVDRMCAGNGELREKVDRLLVHFQSEAPDVETQEILQGVTDTVASLPDPENPEWFDNYRVIELLDAGGMGSVYLAEETPSKRRVAIKTIRTTVATDPVLRRFDAEQRLLGLLDHPYIVPIYQSGISQNGAPYFVMEYLEGSPITDFCEQNALPIRSRVQLIADMCEGLESAHRATVLHRDVKPTNVLVVTEDLTPTPRIIDFGIAKELGPQAQDQETTQLGQVLGTMAYMSPEQLEGDPRRIDARSDVYAVGVVLYEVLTDSLPHSVASGETEVQRVTRRVQESRPQRPSRHLSKTIPPGAQLHRLHDLDWIVLRALDRDPEQRYQTISAMRRDLCTYLAGVSLESEDRDSGGWRSVRTRLFFGGVGVLAVLLTWISFGQGLAVLGTHWQYLLMVGLAVAVGLNLSLLRRAQVSERDGRRRREEAEVYEEQARQYEEEEQRSLDFAAAERASAQSDRESAEERLRQVTRLSDRRRLSDLKARAEGFWPYDVKRLPEMRSWIREALALASRRIQHESALNFLRSRALPYGPDDVRRDAETDPLNAELESANAQLDRLQEVRKRIGERVPSEGVNPEDETGPHALTREEIEAHVETLERLIDETETQIASIENRLGQRRTWDYESAADRWLEALLAELVDGIRAFESDEPESDGSTDPTIASIVQRVKMTERLQATTLDEAEAKAAWAKAITDVEASPLYGGIELTPQFGLLPLGKDPRTGLWQFWHVASGDRPRPAKDPESNSPWEVTEDMGMVMVLVPAGRCVVGVQSEDSNRPNYDPSPSDDIPVRNAEVSAFFVGRYLVTQGQWRRHTGSNPAFSANRNIAGRQHDLRYPVESVSWRDCRRVLSQMGLDLPTGEEWEYAARAGTTTPWWSGGDPKSLIGVDNLADRFAKNNGPPRWVCDDWNFDGFVGPSPVGYFRPNPFGLHDVHGNLCEWCDDIYDNSSEDSHVEADGASTARVTRGGSYWASADRAKIYRREARAEDSRDLFIGVRAIRRLENRG